MTESPTPRRDVVEVQRGPDPGGAEGRLPGVRRNPARPAHHDGAHDRGARSRSSTRRRRRPCIRASAAATSSTASRTRAWRNASAARCAPPPARPTASASSPPRTTRPTASPPASATPRSTRSTSRAASSAATARSPARSTRSRWATSTRWPTTTATDLVFTKEMLLAEPSRAHPAAKERGRVIQVAFFVGAIGALGGAIAVVALRNPSTGARAVVHLVAAGRALPAAARAVRRRGPDRRLRRRGDGALRLRRRLRRAARGAAVRADRRASGSSHRCCGVAFFVELSIAVLGTALSSLSTPRAHAPAGFGTPARSATCSSSTSWSSSRRRRCCCWSPPSAPSCSPRRSPPGRRRARRGRGRRRR